MDVDDFLRTSDLLPEPMLLVSGEGALLASNRAARVLLGLGGGEGALRECRLAGCVGDPPERVEGWLRQASRSRSLVPEAFQIRCADGRSLPYRAEGAVFRPRAGDQPTQILVRLIPKDRAVARFLALDEKIEQLTREIRRREETEQELREQKEWFRVVLASIGDAVIATDVEGRVLLMNAVAEGLTGWTVEDARHRPLAEIFVIINEDSRQTVESPVDRVLREGVIVGLANHTLLIARDGTERPIDDAAAPIRGEDGRLRGVVLTFHDVGDRRILERELRDRAHRLVEEDRRKNEFLAMLAHELRNPLAPLQNTLRLLQSPPIAEADLAWATEIMQRQISHLARMVDDLLDVSRVTHGKIELRQERVSLRRIVSGAVEMTRALVEGRRHELTVCLPTEDVTLLADPARLMQVLSNLLNNAAKYTDEGGRIDLEARVEGQEVAISIRDSGIGIAPDVLPTVFELFSQADQSLARSQGGLGIGLALVRILAQLHGGSVEAYSEGLGLGSTFVLRLPTAPEPSSGLLAPEAPAPGRAAGARRILVVDDLIDSARSLGVLLKFLGHEVVIAHDGESAIETARSFGPEFVLLDIGLPGMDGFEVARRLRLLHAASPPVLIALTGYGMESVREQAREAGFTHHLLKPLDFDELQKLLQGGSTSASSAS